MKIFFSLLGFLAISAKVQAATPNDAINAIQEAKISALTQRLNELEQSVGKTFQKEISCLGSYQDVLDLTLSRSNNSLLLQISEEGFGTGTNAFYVVSRVYEGWNIKELAYTDRVNNGTRVMNVRCKEAAAGTCRLQISVKDNAGGDGLCSTTTNAVVQILNGRSLVKAAFVP